MLLSFVSNISILQLVFNPKALFPKFLPKIGTSHLCSFVFYGDWCGFLSLVLDDLCILGDDMFFTSMHTRKTQHIFH